LPGRPPKTLCTGMVFTFATSEKIASSSAVRVGASHPPSPKREVMNYHRFIGIRAQLPEDLAKDLSPSRPRRSCDADEFLRRVAERADTDKATAERYTKAVFVALSRALEPALFQATWSWAAPRAATALGCESATECSARGPKAAFE
jgi:uncharacterized protein (DUF2267 family)